MNRFIFISIILLITPFNTNAQEVEKIIHKAYYKMYGQTNYALMTMQVIRPTWTRTIKFRSFIKDTSKALIVILSPEKEKGQAFLLRDNKICIYNPKINKIIKIGQSMFSQKWLGSDFSNDELMNEASMLNDYKYKILSQETVQGHKCWKIELTPKENVSVVWGKKIIWIDQKDYLILKTEIYDEDGYLVKTQLATDLKKFQNRLIPTKYIIFSEDEPENKTILIIEDIHFDVNIPDTVFSIQNLKNALNINL